MSASSSHDIFLVDDNPGDVRLVKEALKENNLSSNLYVASDGIEALEFLHKKGNYFSSPTPDLILLDLNMPRMDGRELLSIIKQDAQLKRIPVIVLTTSNSESDIIKSYKLHANAYITKPVDFEEFISAIKKLELFWFSTVHLPPNFHQ